MTVEKLECVVQNFNLGLFNALMIYAYGNVTLVERMDDFFILQLNCEERDEEYPIKLVFNFNMIPYSDGLWSPVSEEEE